MAPNQTVLGMIAPAGNVDEWRFVAEAGDTATVGAVALAEGLDLLLELRAPDGTLLIFDDDGGAGLNPLIEGFPLELSGEIAIRVRTFDATSVGTYRLDLRVLQA